MYDQANKKLVRQQLGRLKRCPLCDSINSRENRECAVCGWGGKFILDRALVADALAALVDQCPSFNEEYLPYSLPKLSLAASARKFFARFRRRVDFRA